MPQAAIATAIIATLLDDEGRFSCLPGMFTSRFFSGGEGCLYDLMAKLSDDYDGGHWKMYSLSNGGFYMAPSSPDTYHIGGQMTGFSGDVSADAAGIIASLFAMGALLASLFDAGHHDEQAHVDAKYYQLIDYAKQHPESTAILRAVN